MKNNKAVGWIALLVVVIIIFAWYSHTPSMPTTSPAAPTTSATVPKTVTLQNANGTTSVMPPLDGQTFRFVSYDNTTIPAGENYEISFSGGVLSGTICSSFSGSYVTNKGALSTNLIVSPKGCTAPADINAADQIFHTVLSQISSFTVINNVLKIVGSGHNLVFNAVAK